MMSGATEPWNQTDAVYPPLPWFCSKQASSITLPMLEVNGRSLSITIR